MELFGSKYLLLLVCAHLMSHTAPAGPTPDELQLDIAQYLAKKGEVAEVKASSRRGECIALASALAHKPSHITHSFEAKIFEHPAMEAQRYLVCVEVEANGDYAVEYFPEE